VRLISHKRRLRLGRRNEEDTSAQFLSERLSSPTASTMSSIRSCGMRDIRLQKACKRASSEACPAGFSFIKRIMVSAVQVGPDPGDEFHKSKPVSSNHQNI
jgi:hypothetical protein